MTSTRRSANRRAARVTPIVGLLSAMVVFTLLDDIRFEGTDVHAAAMPLRCDFDGDGRSDLAVGVPGDYQERGAVNVQYSTGGQLDVGGVLATRHDRCAAAGEED